MVMKRAGPASLAYHLLRAVQSQALGMQMHASLEIPVLIKR